MFAQNCEIMRTRTIKQSEAERVHELFKSAAVTREDLKEKIPSSGFYEYPLTAEDISLRLGEPFSLVLEDNKEILAYCIAYNLENAKRNPELAKDPVLATLPDSQKVYLDQLFLKPGLPLFLVGRLFDSFDNVVQGEKIPDVVCAIPQTPWKNVTSTRLVAYRGFRRDTLVDEGNVRLGVFSKPYYEVTR